MKTIRIIALAAFMGCGLSACGGGGGGGDGGAAVMGVEGVDFGALMTADLSGSARARPNATMGALEAN